MKTYTRIAYSFISDMLAEFGIHNSYPTKSNVENICKVPCNKINAFFRTWLIYSCKGRCCPYTSKKCQLNGSIFSNSITPTEFAMYSILGYDYTNSVLRNLIRRLDRMIHIIKYEDNKFESVYKEFVDEDGNTFRPILSKNDDFTLINKYQNIFTFLQQNVDKKYKELVDLFSSIMKTAEQAYDQLDINKNSVISYLTKDIFFSKIWSIDAVKEQAFVILYILVYRFYEIIDVNMLSGNEVPNGDYINQFYYPEKIFVSNDILYIVLHNRNAMLVYDISGKVKNLLEKEETRDKVLKINSLRGIYLYIFNKKITGINHDVYNAIFKFEDGSYKINGQNKNHKIDTTDTEEYFHFREFISGDETPSVKTHISKNYIVQIKESGKIFIHGDINKDLAFSDLNTYETKISNLFVYKDESINVESFYSFFLSENEKHFMVKREPVKDTSYIVNNDGNLVFYKYNILYIKNKDGNIKEFEISPSSEDNVVKGNRIILLRKDGFIFECTETNGENKQYRYFSYGDNTDSRLGYKYNEETLEEDFSKLHEITDDVCITKKGEVDRSIRIENIVSYSNRLIIRTDANVILGSGRNSGYFCDLSTTDNENMILNKFTPIVNNADIDDIYDIACTSNNTDKPAILLANQYRVYCYGSISYRGFKNGGGFIDTDEVVESKNNNEELFRNTYASKVSLFCTQRCIYSQNVIFDILANNFSYITKDTEISYFNYNRVRDTLNYIKELVVKENIFDGFDSRIRNIEDTSDATRNLNSKTISGTLSDLKAQDISVYIANRYMLKDYIPDDQYSYFGMFINFIVMMSECKKYLRLTEVNERRLYTAAQFEHNLLDINQELPYDKEDRINGYIR